MSQAEKSKPAPWQLRFSLASVLLAMVVISICLAWSRVHLSSGLLVSFLAIPALIRTALVASREAHSQQPLSMLAKVLEFAFSWVLMVPIGLAAIVIGGIVFLAFGLLGLLVSGTAGPDSAEHRNAHRIHPGSRNALRLVGGHLRLGGRILGMGDL